MLEILYLLAGASLVKAQIELPETSYILGWSKC